MALKSGGTSYRHLVQTTRRHKNRVGETFGERQALHNQLAKTEAPRSSFFGKIKDFFLGPKIPNLHDFQSNDKYHGGAHATVTQYLKEVEHGVQEGRRALDADLFEILNKVQNS